MLAEMECIKTAYYSGTIRRLYMPGYTRDLLHMLSIDFVFWWDRHGTFSHCISGSIDHICRVETYFCRGLEEFLLFCIYNK